MIRKVSRVITVALVLVMLLATTAYAGNDGILTSAGKVNDVIDREIEKAIGLADKALNVYTSNVDTVDQLYLDGVITQDAATKRIQRYEDMLDFQLDLIVNTLVIQTESQANALVRAAYNNGIDIVKEYIQVNIAGSIYMIDPLRIVGH